MFFVRLAASRWFRLCHIRGHMPLHYIISFLWRNPPSPLSLFAQCAHNRRMRERDCGCGAVCLARRNNKCARINCVCVWVLARAVLRQWMLGTFPSNVIWVPPHNDGQCAVFTRTNVHSFAQFDFHWIQRPLDIPLTYSPARMPKQTNKAKSA